jgi:hypothetical protein
MGTVLAGWVWSGCVYLHVTGDNNEARGIRKASQYRESEN